MQSPNSSLAAADEARLVADLYRFAFALRARCPQENAVLSPLSLFVAFGMLYLGSRGNTALQLDAVFRFAQAPDLPALLRALAAPPDDAPGLVLTVVNALFRDASLRTRPSFADALRAIGAEVGAVDFAAGDAARAQINAWVSAQTRGLVPDLYAPGALSADTRLVLANTVFFRAAWSKPCSPLPEPAPFNGKPAQMLRVALCMPHAVCAAYTAAAMPYEAGAAHLVFVVPASAAAFDAAEELPRAVAAVLAREADAEVVLTFPKFRVEQAVDLAEALPALGVGDVFCSRADLSGIADEPLFVRAAVHRAVVDVDENGTVGAAATAFGVDAICLREQVAITIDRPFFFAVVDSRRVPLFLGEYSG